jgi:hypothetical protein
LSFLRLDPQNGEARQLCCSCSGLCPTRKAVHEALRAADDFVCASHREALNTAMRIDEVEGLFRVADPEHFDYVVCASAKRSVRSTEDEVEGLCPEHNAWWCDKYIKKLF